MPSERPLFLSLFLALLAQPLPAQQPPGATLTGHVLCADTNAPARFAKVMLKSASPGPQGNDLFSALSQAGNDARKKRAASLSPEETADQKAQLAAASRMMAGLSDLLYSATVAADGTYTFTNVKPGTYYIHAAAPGYIDPVAAIPPADLTSTNPEVRKRVAAAVTSVTIDSSGSARADLRLERGASITGRVLYDDGTPAPGWNVRPVYPQPPGENPFAALGVDASDVDFAHISQAAVTDDTGRFHIAGLTPGDYTLQARLTAAPLGTNAGNPTGMGLGAGSGGAGMIASLTGLRLTVYSGNALRLADAKPIHLTPGEDHLGVEITMPLRALHSISGRVTAQSDGGPVNTGALELAALDAAGKPDAGLHLTAPLHPDGTFRFDYVPGPFTFTLKVTRARDMQPTPPKRPRASSSSTSTGVGQPGSPGSGTSAATSGIGAIASGADDTELPSALAALTGPTLKPAHTYGPASTTLQLTTTDLDNITLTVPETTPAPKPAPASAD